MAQNVQIGIIHQIMPKQDIVGKQSGKTITKRELYLRVDRIDPDTNEIIPEFTKYPKFEFSGQRCDLLDRFKEGQRVAVYFSLDGNFFQKDKDQAGNIVWGHVNNVNAYKILTIEEYKAANGRGQQSYQSQDAAPQMSNIPPQQSMFGCLPNQQVPQGYNPQAAGFAPQNFQVPQPNGMMN